MSVDIFDPFASPLENGVSLIEASAGTGKTFTLAMLVLRYVVEHGIPIETVLVVTFTRAATEELKTRIRTRLQQARKINLGKETSADAALASWLRSLELSADTVEQRLQQSLQNIDQMSIFTIHGFCQRMLKEHALESGQAFDCDLTGDVAQIRQECADDYWRRTVYPRSTWEAAVLCGGFASPEMLLQSVAGVDMRIPVYPDLEDMEALFTGLTEILVDVGRDVPELLRIVADVAEEGKFKTSYLQQLWAGADSMRAWLAGRNGAMPAFEQLSALGLSQGLNGSKFRTSKKNPLSPEQQKSAYLQENALLRASLDQMTELIARIRLNFRRGLLSALREQWEQRLQVLNVMSYDDLIMRLADALQGEKARILTEALQQRYRVVCIDEFQDTDQYQWDIFSALFGRGNQAMYLIGDPKQAVYKFRGADIFTYFAANRQAHRRYTLGRNWRSHPLLVEGVNRLFSRDRPFLLEQLEFHAIAAGRSGAHGELVCDQQSLPPLVLGQVESNAGSGDHWPISGRGDVEAMIARDIVNEICRLLSQAYFIRQQNTDRRLRPGDIAILVRNNKQAEEFRLHLSEAGVPAVLNSKQSVFATEEAANLYHLLLAVAWPGQLKYLRRALALNWFGMNGQDIYRLNQDERLLDVWVERFQGYRLIWQQQGVMSLCHRLFAEREIAVRLAGEADGERRLTNLYHAVELLQQAASDEHLNLAKTLDRLAEEVISARLGRTDQEDRQLRLENDDEAVTLITMHRAKGLEYAVVFCPALWQRNGKLAAEKYLVKCHEYGSIVADLGSGHFDRRKQQALYEELAEDLRLMYVALTRAQFRCYLYWADVHAQDRSNDSAPAYLFDFSEANFEAQQQWLQSLCAAQPQIFSYRLLGGDLPETERYQPPELPATLQALAFRRTLHTHWQMSSYTALSSLSMQESFPELPLDKAEEELEGWAPAEDELLPKGADTGNVLHALLENCSFQAIAGSEIDQSLRDQSCKRFGLNVSSPEIIDQLLKNVVDTPLLANGEFRLSDISARDCVKEMPFYLAMGALDVALINAVLTACPAFQPLSSRELAGYLTGYIDLLCRYRDRYYIIDYKSNALPDYRAETLTAAMRAHNYGLQYWLYSVAVHQYLQQRLPGYDYAKHFGGIKYLFVRGMRPEFGLNGVFSDQPDYEKLCALSEVFFSR